MTLPLPLPLFTILSTLVEEHSGLHYDVADLSLFGDKVSCRAIEAGYDSLLDYYYFLKYDPGGPAELQRLVEGLLVHESFFFREADQLEVFVEQAAAVVASGERLRIWSAACANGEEPLTLAMLFASRGIRDRVEIVASDLSLESLARAQRGEFGKRALRAMPEALVARWLSPISQERAAIQRELVEGIQWRHCNLLDPDTFASFGRFHAILCRNVLIYFTDETIKRVVSSLLGALHPDGQLLVGASESLLRFGTSLLCEERGGAFFYRRPA